MADIVNRNQLNLNLMSARLNCYCSLYEYVNVKHFYISINKLYHYVMNVPTTKNARPTSVCPSIV